MAASAFTFFTFSSSCRIVCIASMLLACTHWRASGIQFLSAYCAAQVCIAVESSPQGICQNILLDCRPLVQKFLFLTWECVSRADRMLKRARMFAGCEGSQCSREGGVQVELPHLAPQAGSPRSKDHRSGSIQQLMTWSIK